MSVYRLEINSIAICKMLLCLSVYPVFMKAKQFVSHHGANVDLFYTFRWTRSNLRQRKVYTIAYMYYNLRERV